MIQSGRTAGETDSAMETVKKSTGSKIAKGKRRAAKNPYKSGDRLKLRQIRTLMREMRQLFL